MKKSRSFDFFVRYSMLYLIACIVVFFWYLLSGRTFIWHYDGFGQHYQALIYYGSYLRDLLHGNYHAWSFCLGEGGDVLQILHYYGIGDPLNLFSFFFNSENMYILYNILGLIRIYLAGLAFAYYCHATGVRFRSLSPLLMGSISYAFSLWAIYNTARHPFFVTPMICLPLVLAGCEKIIGNRKSNLFILSVCLAAITNLYFFFIIVLLTVFYVAVRLIYTYRTSVYEYIRPLIRLVYNSVIGLMMAGIIVVPVVFSFASDIRADIDFDIRLLFDADYYASLLSVLLGTTTYSYTCANICLPAVFALILFVGNRDFLVRASDGIKRIAVQTKIFMLIILAFFLFPFFGQLFNNFGYASEKWALVFPFVISFVLFISWEGLLKVPSALWVRMTIGIATATAVLLIIPQNRNVRVISTILILMVSAVIAACLMKRKSEKRMNIFMAALVILSSGISSFWLNSHMGDGYSMESYTYEEMTEIIAGNEINAINSYISSEGYTADGINDSFYRIAGNGIQINGGLNGDGVRGNSSVMGYWSITNPYVSRFVSDMDVAGYVIRKNDGYDGRTILNELSAVGYYSAPDDDKVIPYGFEPVSSDEGRTLYRNKYALPIVYSYDEMISDEAWETLNTPEREEALLRYLLPADDGITGINSVSEYCPEQIVECDYEIVLLNGEAEWDEEAGEILVESGVALFELNISSNNAVGGEELLVVFEGLRPSVSGISSIIFQTDDGVRKRLDIYPTDSSMYNGRQDFVINLGRRDGDISRILIGISSYGMYEYDSIKIMRRSLSDYEQQIAKLTECTISDLTVQDDNISLDINLPSRKAVLFAVPYSDGWSATVNGQEYELTRANGKYMALVLDEGDYSVRLEYHNGLITVGAGLSAAGCILFAVNYIYANRKYIKEKAGKK